MIFTERDGKSAPGFPGAELVRGRIFRRRRFEFSGGAPARSLVYKTQSFRCSVPLSRSRKVFGLLELLLSARALNKARETSAALHLSRRIQSDLSRGE